MHPLQLHTLVIATSLFLFSTIIFLINHIYYHYPGGLYYHAASPWILLVLTLMYLGFKLQFGQTSKSAKKTLLTTQVFLVMLLITLASNAVQLTPFEPIDAHILGWDTMFHIDLNQIVAWTHSHPRFYQIINGVYHTLPLQMTYFPLLLILLGESERVHEYCFLLLLTTFIGFAFYYFFPTIAPASTILGEHFMGEQYATGLKFYQIHKHIPPSTLDGGLIAFPSFHVIWVWLCAYSLRGWVMTFIVILALNGLLIIACVCLGWHYVLDIIGSILVISIGHYIYMKLYPSTRLKLRWEPHTLQSH